jgi:hypothetical protein
MLTTYSEKVCCVVVGASTEDMNESGMVVTDVHQSVTLSVCIPDVYKMYTIQVIQVSIQLL